MDPVKKTEWYGRAILVRMSHSEGETRPESHGRTSLADYRNALSTPRSRRPLVASVLARLPIAMIGISALLYVQHQTGTFAAAGLVSASVLAGVAVGSVVQGRIIDRFGPTRPLLVVTGLFVTALTSLVVAIEMHAPVPALVACAAALGLFEPATGSASRALWGRLVPEGPAREAAYSYEAISMETFFILGPGLAGVLIALPWPGTGLVLGGACMAFGAAMFALSPAVREWGPNPQAGSSMLGALASPGMRTLAIAALGFGIVIGFVEVAVPAAAEAAGNVSLGGLLLSLWSVSSVAFGVAYSLRPWPRTLPVRLPVLLGAFGALVGLMAWPSTLWGLAIAMLAAGAVITPQSTTHSTTIEVTAPKDTAAEAFAWVLTSVTLGIALGQSVSGYLVEHASPSVAFLVAGVVALALAGAVALLRGTIRPHTPAAGRKPALAA
ncbi:putative MFS family arabinose efflux permease [Prauserella rugosa]|uniref:Putative MFS family arabinose efflux permease n=2 Tax=Prauserella rugosa TaxID=43354 RepID=A0A660CJD1_9PSEU|nr:arabinose efflux permease family protein [Prauserella sp. Am3]TWH21221.1 putative MFS family arabinose efflux permease [Prauserella rugosa]